ncbi:MAG: hypothetical protein DRJ47_01660 [Thermoprotei archaeon]|nr:MAG: hypothetical protein DRJ47_01660 [Thermoprotei archaeon]
MALSPEEMSQFAANFYKIFTLSLTVLTFGMLLAIIPASQYFKLPAAYLHRKVAFFATSFITAILIGLNVFGHIALVHTVLDKENAFKRIASFIEEITILKNKLRSKTFALNRLITHILKRHSKPYKYSKETKARGTCIKFFIVNQNFD